jgi:hypothetical protein
MTAVISRNCGIAVFFGWVFTTEAQLTQSKYLVKDKCSFCREKREVRKIDF